MRYLLSALAPLALLTLPGCATGVAEPEMASVSGQALYRERIAAPPGARLEVVLEDISRADAPAERLGEVVIEQAGQPPYEFTIDYDPAQIQPAHEYRVRARLLEGDELLFVTDQVHPVITRGNPSSVTLLLRRVERAPAHPLGPLPATYTGSFPPCAGCREIGYHLNLLPDGAFFLRETDQDSERGSSDLVGRYLLSSDHQLLSLYGGREAPMRFSISARGTRLVVDRDGPPIESELDYSLHRQATLQQLEPRLFMGGMYRYLAGAGRFHHCLSGLDMPVATEAENALLEAAYLEAREQPGEAVRVSLDGRIVQRMPMEGPGPVFTLVPERFVGASPGLDCPPTPVRAELENSYWKLTLLESEGVQRAPSQREPHLVFDEEGRLAGSDGCNRVIGAYELDGASIGFSGLAATRMACLEGMAQAEQFRHALEKVSRYRIVGQLLEMLDAENKLIMRFEATAQE